MHDTPHHSAKKMCHAHNPRLDKLDKFVKMLFSTKWTENISRMMLHRKYVITLHRTNCKICKNVIFNKVDKKYIMDDTAHRSAQKICHAYSPRLDKLDKFLKISFSTKCTENISWMILRTTLHRKYVTLIALDWTNWTNL